MPSRRPLSRIAALLAAVLVAGAGAPSPAAAAGGAEVTREHAPVVDRGRVDARAASRSAERRVGPHELPRLSVPGLEERLSPWSGAEAEASIPAAAGPSSGPLSIGAFPGTGNAADGLGLEPPDSWMAAGGPYLVHATNGLVKVFNRSGGTLMTVPTWALFALSPAEHDADPRILWDATRGRWVGVLFSYTLSQDFTTVTGGWLNLAISESGDPRGSWRVLSYGYTDSSGSPTMPDYPGISSSSDKVVLTANEFNASMSSYLGASILVLRWTDLLSGGAADPVLWTNPNPGLFTIRPAIVQAAAADVHLVAMRASSSPGPGDVMYGKLVGSAPASPSFANLSTSGTVPPFCATQAPRQPGSPATITRAVDARATDAVWRAGRLAFVSTCAADGSDFVRVTQLNTGTSPVSLVSDARIGPGGGTDAYMGGVAFSGDGTLFLSYTQSSGSQVPSTYAAAFRSGGWSPSVLVNPGDGSYGGTRWGDYVGLAPDPAGTAAVWQANQVTDGAGSWETRVSRLVLDTTPPTATGPGQALIGGSTLGNFSVPVSLAWTVADAGSGVTRTHLTLDQWGTGAYAAGSVDGTSARRLHWWKLNSQSALDRSYQYGASAEDAAGNRSAPAAGPRLTPVVYQQTSGVTYAGTWSTASASAYSGGSVRWSRTAGSSATFRTTARSFALVTYLASTRGKAKVYVDGVLKKTLTLTSTTTRARNLAYVVNFPAAGTHTIKVVVASGRVDVDAFVVLR